MTEKRVAFACPICDHHEATRFIDFGVQEIVRCGECGLLVSMPQLSAKEIHTLYEGGCYYTQGRAQRFSSRVAEWVMCIFRFWRARQLLGWVRGSGSKRILDIGCGRGYTLAFLKREGCHVYGTQVSRVAADFAKDKLGLNDVFWGDVSEAHYPDSFFDLVSIYHVLEHVADPIAQLEAIRRVLKPEGVLYVEVPNAGGWAAQALEHHWLAYDLPQHRVHFTPKTLTELLKRCKYDLIRVEFGSLEYSPITLMQSIMNALLGGKSVLFRHLTGERSLTRVGCGGWLKLLFHGLVAGLLIIPVSFVSVIFTLCGFDDTMRVICRKPKICEF